MIPKEDHQTKTVDGAEAFEQGQAKYYSVPKTAEERVSDLMKLANSIIRKKEVKANTDFDYNAK